MTISVFQYWFTCIILLCILVILQVEYCGQRDKRINILSLIFLCFQSALTSAWNLITCLLIFARHT